ncbi:DUF3301 domain-containing protein [Vibrio zhugei]|uniref:DUF3301 domain-containing protein n=1 Tax=Vibrio zhugei TaxID=2479546 RepID=A0ABV7C4Z7_9VIBR|nr:DUF3301 domain-containing protein [Vibrio zhugei]
MRTGLFGLLLIGMVGFIFWQQRRQSEIARRVIEQKCAQLNLQVVSVAFGQHRLRTPSGQWHWHSTYFFEFSALGDDCYQGRLIMNGFRSQQVYIPPHHLPPAT